jgi:predicted RNA-binding Zn-ribbon protein involved in translation (DUF1610 family)
MSELFDKLKESAGQVIAGVDKGGKIQSAIGAVRQQLAEADRKRKVSLVQQEIRELQTQETQAINALSAQVLALHEAATLTQPELVSLCRNIDDIRKQLHEREAELAQLLPHPPQAASAAPTVGASCPKCGSAVVSGAAFCQSCGLRLAPEAKAPVLFCIHCGSQLRDNARFCPKCGQTVVQPS